MSATVMFKCPCCGGYLEFDPGLQKFKCLYCGQVLSDADLREQSEQREAEAEAKTAASGDVSGEGSATGSDKTPISSLRTYHCQMCGAEIVTEETTAATRCYYCHSPVVLHDRLDEEFRPDGVIPFVLDKEAAKAKFTEFVKKKKFIDRSFFDEAQLEMFSGVYYPYWYFDVEGEAAFDGEGTRRSVATSPTHIVTTTRFFRVTRRARMAFRSIARKALGKLDGKLSDGIHPFDPEGVKPYASGYLSGFLAEKRDVEEDNVRQEMLQEVYGYADRMIRQNHSYNSLNGQATFQASRVESRYVLLPVWVLTWKGGRDGVPYYYLMNGQTGKVCGKLPINRTKLMTWAIGAGALVFALLCAGGKFIW